jgi:two-component system, NarL family, response regulator YdfI
LPNASKNSLIRVLVVADSVFRTKELAAVLAEDAGLEILSASGAFEERELEGDMPDVTVAMGLLPTDLALLPSPLVVLSNAPQPPRGLAASVHAWLPLRSSAAELSAAILAAASDLFVLTSEQRRSTMPRAGEDDNPPAFIERLTPRELQVLRLMADGLANKEIAWQLGFSDHTAKFHVAQILAKLGASTRTEAVTLGIRCGLVPV